MRVVIAGSVTTEWADQQCRRRGDSRRALIGGRFGIMRVRVNGQEGLIRPLALKSKAISPWRRPAAGATLFFR
jgi:hypothetical protein